MSEAKVSLPDIFKTDACSQCARQFPPSPVSFDARHAVPCGHVLCGDCVHRVEAEQKSGPSFCRRPGCGKELASANEFWAAWCTARSGSMFETQRNVQERSRPTCTECERDPVTGKQHLATHRCETCGDGAYFCTEISSVHPRLKASRGHIMVALDPPRALCAQHQLPFEVVEASSQRPMCAACVKAAGPDVAVQTFDKAIAALDTVEASANQATLATFTRGLAEPTFTAPQLYAYVTRWGVQEATRIRAWEEREVKSVQVAANETLQLVQAVCTRKLVEGASLIMQRVGLRASLEELDRVLTDLPSEPLSRLKRKRAVYVERAKLCKLLASEKIAVPSAQGILRWAQLPSLSGYFGEKRADSESAPAIRVSSAAASILSEARMRAFGSGPGPVAPSEGKDHSLGPHAHHGVARANPLKGVPARSARRLRTPVRFHTARVLICLTVVRRSLLWSNLFIPANPPTLHFQIPLEPAAPRSLRSISMSHKPSAFVGLDSKTIVVGFRDAAPLQVWDLADGKLVRELDGVVKACQSMVNLPDQRVAVGCRDGLRFVVTVFDVSTGRKIQELAELGGDIHGLAFVENRLLTVCGDKTLRAWSQDNEGMVRGRRKRQHGVLSASLVPCLLLLTASPRIELRYPRAVHEVGYV